MIEARRPQMPPIARLGDAFLRLLGEMGAMLLFLLEAVSRLFTSFGQVQKTVRQVYFIGVKSVSVITLISLFTGMVIGLQMYYALAKFGADGFLGAAVSLSLVRELGPVLTAIMITGRAGSSMTAEIGVMRISEQVDALQVMDINPMGYLVSPKLAASIICFPILTAFFDLVGMVGGYLTGVLLLGGNSGVYWYRVGAYLQRSDISGGFIKSLVFGVVVCTVSCYMGYFTHLRRDSVGPEAVSQATTSAVVTSCVLILLSDYVLTSLLF
ncbi:phospholipid/cholesterol/gamma-HCH transport system permease protein [Humidesulfovibrio mexicanus]|uniref:Phospholipid/cholesterol/gamma-HCH transport system permease protein n=1 Tax=Humidesulfovibrio mexicanus TaxID=147047 RepID=A0A239AMZ0_9BACT|nr:ABC transporter permease [Humidesulfovibrio mexicanus]SNR96358.1 phospholipid/cholesterol/gamma-HCH transport system permease protein [Humidesulfovibrio mexicanus]